MRVLVPTGSQTGLARFVAAQVEGCRPHPEGMPDISRGYHPGNRHHHEIRPGRGGGVLPQEGEWMTIFPAPLPGRDGFRDDPFRGCYPRLISASLPGWDLRPDCRVADCLL